MAVFPVNQVRHFYVGGDTVHCPIQDGDAVKTIGVGFDERTRSVYLVYQGVAGPSRSDLIPVENISYISSKKGSEDAHPLNLYKVVVNGAVKDNTEYQLVVDSFQVEGPSDEYQSYHSGFYKTGVGTTASDLYKGLALDLAKSVSRYETSLFNVYLTDGSVNTEVVNTTAPASLTGTYTGVLVEDARQPWRRGVYAYKPVINKIRTVSENEVWGTVSVETPINKIKNGLYVADLEWFCMGERGDIYRGVGYPNVVETKYLVDSEKEYDVVNIQYAYTGFGVNSYRSEKDITVVFEGGASSKTADFLKALKTAVESAHGDFARVFKGTVAPAP